jgi:hypothetical protein
MVKGLGGLAEAAGPGRHGLEILSAYTHGLRCLAGLKKTYVEVCESMR